MLTPPAHAMADREGGRKNPEREGGGRLRATAHSYTFTVKEGREGEGETRRGGSTRIALRAQEGEGMLKGGRGGRCPRALLFDLPLRKKGKRGKGAEKKKRNAAFFLERGKVPLCPVFLLVCPFDTTLGGREKEKKGQRSTRGAASMLYPFRGGRGGGPREKKKKWASVAGCSTSFLTPRTFFGIRRKKKSRFATL